MLAAPALVNNKAVVFVPSFKVPDNEFRVKSDEPPEATVSAAAAFSVVLVPNDTVPDPACSVILLAPNELIFTAPALAAVEVIWMKFEVPLVPWTSKISLLGEAAEVCLITTELMPVVGATVKVPVNVLLPAKVCPEVSISPGLDASAAPSVKVLPLICAPLA